MSTPRAPIVSMIEHGGTVFVATTEGVYRLDKKTDKLERLAFVELEPDDP